MESCRGVAKMEVGLNREESFGGRTRTPACGDVPGVAEGIFGFAPTVTRRMLVGGRIDGSSTGCEGTGIRGVGVGDIQVSGHWTRWILLVGIAELDDGIADGDFGVHDAAVSVGNADALGAFESSDKEVDKFRGVADEEVRRDVREIGTAELSGFFRLWGPGC